MSRERQLVKNTMIITIGKICTQFVSFLLLPLYTAILSTSEYGVVDLFHTLTSLLLPITTLQLEQALFRELVDARTDSKKRNEIITTGTLALLFQGVVCILVFLVASEFIESEYTYFLALNVAAQSVLSILLQIARGCGCNTRYAIASFVSAVSTIVLNVGFILNIENGAKGMLLAMFLSSCIAGGYLFISMRLFRNIRVCSFDGNLLKRLIKFSLPLIPNTIAWWIIDASDRVIVSSMMGIEFNGVLSASLKFAALVTSANYVFTLSWTESALVNFHDADFREYFNRMLNTVLRFFVSVVVGIVAIMPYVFPMLINAQYSDGYDLVPISLLATLFNVLVGLISVIYVGYKDTRAIALTSISAAVVNFFTHIFLIKHVGLYAAVFSSFVAFFIMAILRLFDIRRRYLRIQLDRGLVMGSSAMLLFVYVLYYINDAYLNVLMVMSSLIFAIVFNKATAKEIINIVAKKR